MNTIKTAAHLRYTAIQMSHRSKAAHLASSLSCIDILTVLYEKILKINPRKRDQKRDRFILSKGHAAGALYATLAHKGFFNKNKLLTYATKGSLLEEHPNPKLNGIEAPTGSLGHGLPIACGMALSAKILNLKNDPALIKKYIEHHKNVWPDVLKALSESGSEDMKIFIQGTTLCMYSTVKDDYDPQKADEIYNKYSITQKWEELMQV